MLLALVLSNLSSCDIGPPTINCLGNVLLLKHHSGYSVVEDVQIYEKYWEDSEMSKNAAERD